MDKPSRSRSIHRPTVAAALLLVLVSTAHESRGDDPTPQPTAKLEPVRVYMPDGQLQSHLVSVYVTAELTQAMKPRLRLFSGHSITEGERDEDRPLRPLYVVPHQQWTEQRGDRQISPTGTLLLFDLSKRELIPFQKAMSRFRPIVEWNGAAQRAVGPREVNLGRTVSAWTWTVAIILSMVALLAGLSGAAQGSRPSLKWLCIEDGHYSLARTQILIWTVAIGAMVLFYGLVRLSVPSIPETLLALMAMSLVTGGARYVAPSSPVSTPPAHRAGPRLSDLIFDFSSDPSGGMVSIARAQMLFWTLLIVLLFVIKSSLDGELWNVPIELVALMGISQAGYVLPKFDTWVKPAKATAAAGQGTGTVASALDQS